MRWLEQSRLAAHALAWRLYAVLRRRRDEALLEADRELR